MPCTHGKTFNRNLRRIMAKMHLKIIISWSPIALHVTVFLISTITDFSTKYTLKSDEG